MKIDELMIALPYDNYGSTSREEDIECFLQSATTFCSFVARGAEDYLELDERIDIIAVYLENSCSLDGSWKGAFCINIDINFYFVDVDDLEDLIKTIGHEVRHAWQESNGWEFNYDLPHSERPHEKDANEFQEEFLEHWLDKHGDNIMRVWTDQSLM